MKAAKETLKIIYVISSALWSGQQHGKYELITRQLQHIFIPLLLYISLGIVAIRVSWLSRLSSTFVLHQVFSLFVSPPPPPHNIWLFFHSSVGAFGGWRGPPPPPPPWYFRTLALLYTKGGGPTLRPTDRMEGAATTLYFPSLQLPSPPPPPPPRPRRRREK